MINVTRPLKIDEIETLNITSAELTKDGNKLVVNGTDPNTIPIRFMVYVGNEVAQDIIFGAIFSQLGWYGQLKTLADAIKKLNELKGALQVKAIKESYEDALTGEIKTGTRIILNPNEF